MSTLQTANIFCTYLTFYYGNKLPPFYIGYSTVNKINKGYKGSVSSKKYKNIWKKELKENLNLFKTKIISYHLTKEEAIKKEIYLQKKMNVLKNDMYINRSIGRHYDNTGNQHSEKTKFLISIKNKGKIGPRKGIKCPGIGGVKKGNIPWNKGLKTGPLSEECRKKLSISIKNSIQKKGGVWNKNIKYGSYKTKGLYKWYYNPETKETKMFKENEQPLNWVKGFKIDREKKYWYYNPNNITQTILVKTGEEPKNWIRGRGITGKRSKGKFNE